MYYKSQCPICKREYDGSPQQCQCGFELIKSSTFEENNEAFSKKELFNIYKFTKRVVLGEIPYTPSELELIERSDGKTCVYEALENRGLAYINCVGNGGKITCADMGVIALRTGMFSLILNTDEADSRFLDEGHIRMLFLGPDFKRFTDGYIVPFAPVRYLWVDPENKFFTSEDNVLFNKEMTELIFYPRHRPEAEYRVPQSVKRIGENAFCGAEYLKKLYLPEWVRIDDDWLKSGDIRTVEIVYY